MARETRVRIQAISVEVGLDPETVAVHRSLDVMVPGGIPAACELAQTLRGCVQQQETLGAMIKTEGELRSLWNLMGNVVEDLARLIAKIKGMQGTEAAGFTVVGRYVTDEVFVEYSRRSDPVSAVTDVTERLPGSKDPLEELEEMVPKDVVAVFPGRHVDVLPATYICNSPPFDQLGRKREEDGT